MTAAGTQVAVDRPQLGTRIGTRIGAPPVAGQPGGSEIDPDGLARFCELAFTSFSRSDQRRWGETYVKGLLTVPGRKTIQKISELVGCPSADQSLQQFVNQSPWDWGPVRFMVAQLLSTSLPVEAWIADEVAFPKNGCNSVGVTSQYVPSVGRTLNCQVALALTMAGERLSCPVNWRLMLPRCWDTDPDRRRKAHVPPAERHRPAWQHMLDLIDEAALGWGLTPPPIVADRRHDPAVEPLLRSLEDRGARYVVKVADDMPCGTVAARPGRVIRAGELVRHSIQQRVTLAAGPGAIDRPFGSQFIAVPVPGPGGLGPAGLGPAGLGPGGPGPGGLGPGGPGPGGAAGPGRPPALDGPGRPARRARRIVAQRQWGRRQPFALWVTNLSPGRLPEVARLVRLHELARGDLAELEQGAGLQHFEGRSFRGWHHHVTLASVAHAYRMLSTDRPDTRRPLHAVAR